MFSIEEPHIDDASIRAQYFQLEVLIGGIETCIKKTATITTASNEEEAQ